MTLFQLLQYEIEHGTQRSAAVLYAICFLTKGELDEPGVVAANQAIIRRWSRSGLERVKNFAWAIADANAPDAAIPPEPPDRK